MVLVAGSSGVHFLKLLTGIEEFRYEIVPCDIIYHIVSDQNN